MSKLTKRQTEVLQLIQDQMQTTGAPPTRAEIASKMGFRSPNAAEDHLRALARKGVIELVPGTSRGIRLRRDVQGLPVIGKVAAGEPILSEAHIDASHRIDPTIFRPTADYLLKVRGESMSGAGISDGDLLVVHISPEAFNGQIVVVRVNNEVTVKRFFRDEHIVTLKPENPEFQPMQVDLREQAVLIEGLAVGVIRPFNTLTPVK